MHFGKSHRIMLPFSDFSSVFTAFTLADSIEFYEFLKLGKVLERIFLGQDGGGGSDGDLEGACWRE